MVRVLICFLILTTFGSLKASSQLSFKDKTNLAVPMRLGAVLPQNFYNKHKGFMCKKEDQLQKGTGLNLFIRLGSKSYTDYLERKPNSGFNK